MQSLALSNLCNTLACLTPANSCRCPLPLSLRLERLLLYTISTRNQRYSDGTLYTGARCSAKKYGQQDTIEHDLEQLESPVNDDGDGDTSTPRAGFFETPMQGLGA